MHLLVDGYTEDTDFLTSKDRIWNWLLEAANRIGMTPMALPQVVSFGKSHGLTGILVIAESHISIHTWPEMGGIQADCFSCRDFASGAFVDLLCQRAGMESPTVLGIERGVKNGKLVIMRGKTTFEREREEDAPHFGRKKDT